jgi:ADP-heptose:LPS heptosyltransferase
MDLVICIDSAVAHLAGALGCPTWLLLPHAPDFRWMLARDDSPWYPSMRIFRQQQVDDWDGVVESVVEELKSFNKR